MSDTRPHSSANQRKKHPTGQMDAVAPYHGALSGTRREDVSVASSSGRAFVAGVFVQVNVSKDPNLKASVLDGTLNEVTDPFTNARYELAVPFFYHDPAIRFFALVAPSPLRHRELPLRIEALEKLRDTGEAQPAYVRGLSVVFGAAELQRAVSEHTTDPSDTGEHPEVARLHAELAERQSALAEERQRLEAMRLNLEEAKARLNEKEGALIKAGKLAQPTDDSPTTVVPREVFFKSSPATPKKDPPPLPPPPKDAPKPLDLDIGGKGKPTKRDPSTPWQTGLEDGWELDDGPSSSRERSPLAKKAASSSSSSRLGKVAPPEVKVTDDIPRSFNRLKAGSRTYYHADVSGRPLMAYRLDDSRLQAFVEGKLSLYLQIHDLDEFPLITLLLAAEGDDGVTDDIYWPLDVRKAADLKLLEKFMGSFTLRVGLYGEDLNLRQVFEFAEDSELNATHVSQLAQARLEENKGSGVAFDAALRRIEDPEYERLGSMRHNFHRESFESLTTSTEAKLAAGIVGYWSGPETFRYLIENRSFSLEWFAQIQERVARAAKRFGVSLSTELRQVAVHIELADDESHLLDELAATWAQVSLGLGGVTNDLDEMGQWENWQDLIDAFESRDKKLDAELAELAAASLRRAQLFAKDNDLLADLPDELNAETIESSEMTMIDASGGMSELSRPEVIDLLEDEDLRLNAALHLLRDGGGEVLTEVMVAAEGMSDEELGLLSETLAEVAPSMEAELITALELDSPTIPYLAGFALSSFSSEKALPKLMLLLEDPARFPEPRILAEVMTFYQARLVEELIPRVLEAKELTVEHPLVVLLAELARVEGGEIYDLASAIPEAVELAREVNA